MIHSELIKYGVKWLKKQQGFKYTSPIITTELVTGALETPDILGFSQSHSVLIECKVSHADFLADFKKTHRRNLTGKGLGTYRFYLCPNDLISVKEVPEKWGLLYCHMFAGGSYQKITIEKEPSAYDYGLTRTEEYYVLYSLLRRNINQQKGQN